MGYKIFQHRFHRSTRSSLSPWTKFHFRPQEPTYGEYVPAIELVCQALRIIEAEELRADMYRVLRHSHTPKPNLKWGRTESFQTAELRHKLHYTDCIQRGGLGCDECIKKAKILLKDPSTCRLIPTDPTNKHKAKFIDILWRIKTEIGKDETIYEKMDATEASSPKFYGLPKFHKEDIPLKLIVSSRGSVT